MKKTLFLTLEYPPFKGGVGNYVASLFQLLPEDKRVLAVPKNFQVEEKIAKHFPLSTRFVWPHWLPALFSLFKIVRNERIEHVILFHVLPVGTIVWLISFFCDFTYSISVHGLDVIQHTHNPWKKFLLKRIFAKADSIIANSSFTAKILKTYDVLPYKIALLPPTAHVTPELYKEKPFRLALKDKKNILIVGRMVQRKNPFGILEVAKKLVETRDDIQFTFIGQGPLLKSTQQTASQYGLSSSIFFLDTCTDEELASAYASCSLLLFLPKAESNKDAEGFGIVALEASSFGKPVVASNQGGVPDAVLDGRTGLLVDPTNIEQVCSAIIRIIDNPQFADQLGREGKKRYEAEFSKVKRRHTLQTVVGDFFESDISVCIPAHNSEKTIQACLDSVFRQTIQPKEIIVVDDGSKDRTASLVQKNSRVTLVQQNQQGAPVARNTAAARASGAYLLFLDSDITMHPRMLEIMRRSLDLHPDASFAYSRFYFGWKKFPLHKYSFEQLTSQNYIHTSSLIRAKDFPGFDPKLKRHQDWDLWLTLGKNSKFGLFIDRYLYRIHPEKNRISTWLPSFVYTLPCAHWFTQVKKYENSVRIIKEKHHLS